MSAGYIIYSLDGEKFRQLVERPTPDQLTPLAKLVRDGLEEYDGEFDEGDPALEWPKKVKLLAPIVSKRLALPEWYGDLSRAGKMLWEGVIFNACMNCDDIDVGFRAENDGIGWDVIELAWKQLGVVPNTITDVALSTFRTRPYRYQPTAQPATTREQHDHEEGEHASSLDALGKMLGQFVEDAKSGKADPSQLLKGLQTHKGVSQKHKDLLKDLLSDDESGENEDDDEDWTPMHMHTPEEVRKMQAELESVRPAVAAAKKKDVRQQYEKDLTPAIERIAGDGRMLFVQVDT